MTDSLYPPIEAFDSGHLEVSNLHSIYYERCGNPKGIPVIFIHGGPGGGTSENDRRFFDPQKYHTILFHQRGCGKSRPAGCLEDNTTWTLIEDIEKLREKFNLDKWILFGGSWGSTLALAYAISHPDRISHMVIRGIFLMRPQDMDWAYVYGANQIFPDAFAELTDGLSDSEKQNLVETYFQKLMSSDDGEKREAANRWFRFEAAISRLEEGMEKANFSDELKYEMSVIECHYFRNRAFFPSDNYLLENISKIQNIPTWIVQGRYDAICPAGGAWDLKNAHPKAKLEFVNLAGHTAHDPELQRALVKTMDQIN